MPFTGSETLTRPYALSREPQVLTENLSGKRIRLEDEILSEPNFAEVVGRSSVLRGVLRQVEIVARPIPRY
jgi:transcriptional regulator with GAF, ATPase, and Fis domain